MEPAEFVCAQWSRRQELLYFTLDRMQADIDSDTLTGQPMSLKEVATMLSKMTPNATGAFNITNSVFEHDYKRTIAPVMYHNTRARPDNYRVIDLLSSFVFDPVFDRGMGDGKTRSDLLPRKPDAKHSLPANTRLSRWQTWSTALPDDARRILSLPPPIPELGSPEVDMEDAAAQEG
jgi:hypothetical protein